MKRRGRKGRSIEKNREGKKDNKGKEEKLKGTGKNENKRDRKKNWKGKVMAAWHVLACVNPEHQHTG